MKIRGWFVVMFAFLSATGCIPIQQIANNSPPAQTPVLTSLHAAPSATDAFAPVTAEGAIDVTKPFISTPGVFRVLSSAMPNGLPKGAIKIFFTAPALLTLKVDIEGRLLYKFEDVPANLDPNVVGYYRIENLDASADSWQVTIHPPLSPIPRFGLTINVSTVSINPNYATGPNHESAPLVIKLGAKPFRVGLAQPMTGSPCAIVPNLPRLRPGLTISTADVGLAKIHVGCCTFPADPNVGIDGIRHTGQAVGFPFPDFTKYSLVMKVGTQHAQGGWHEKFTTNQAGPLEICVNDNNLADNRGGWGIDILISE